MAAEAAETNSEIARGYSDRIEFDPALLTQPDALFDAMVEQNIETRNTESIHHDEWWTATTLAILRMRDRRPNGSRREIEAFFLVGGNLTPVPEADPRNCSEMGAMRAFLPGDVFLGAGLLGVPEPERSKPIQDCPQDVIITIPGFGDVKVPPPCGPCRPVLQLISRRFVLGTMFGDSGDVAMTASIGQHVHCQDNHGKIHPRQGEAAREHMASRLALSRFELGDPFAFQAAAEAIKHNPRISAAAAA